jgi:hypothetical protein
MALAKTARNTARSVKKATKKAARKVDRAIVEPVADLFRSKAHHGKGTSKSKTTRSTKAKKK